MGTYIPNTEKEQSKMLEAAGYTDFEDLFSCIPEELIYKKELNLVSWNGAEPKIDIRTWSPNGAALKGLTLTES